MVLPCCRQVSMESLICDNYDEASQDNNPDDDANFNDYDYGYHSKLI